MSGLKNKKINRAQLVELDKKSRKSRNTWVANLLIILCIILALLACVGIALNVVAGIYYDMLTDGFDGLDDLKFDLKDVDVKDSINNMDIYGVSSNASVAHVTSDGREDKTFSDIEEVIMANYQEASKNIVSKRNIVNYVFIGKDAYKADDDKDVYADVIMIISYNTKINKVTYYTLDPNSLVYIPEIMDGEGKVAPLSNAYTWGKDGKLLCKTVQENFGIAINGYIDVDIDAASSAIDTLGGVTLSDVDVDELNEAIKNFNKDFGTDASLVSDNDGKVKLDGIQAAAYVRSAKSRLEAMKNIFKATLITAADEGLLEVVDIIDQLAENIMIGSSYNDFSRVFRAGLVGVGLQSIEHNFVDGMADLPYSLVVGEKIYVNFHDNAAIRDSLKETLY